MAVIPHGLQGVATDEAETAEFKTLRTVADVRTLDMAHDIGFSTAGGAGTVAAEEFQWKKVFHPIAPDQREFVADDFGAGGMKLNRIGHEEKVSGRARPPLQYKFMIHHLYVHTPFCAKICPYCAFYVLQGGAAQQREFVAALRTEWQRAKEEFPLALDTIYFGGGTPSILSADLFSELAKELPSERTDTEFTLEVNPATVTDEKAAVWRAAGVNRISLGAQSFDAGMLKILGRQHVPGDIAETCSLLRKHGFENINIDLMFALPGQSEAGWKETLLAALACKPNHVSAYGLTYEEDTPFFEKLQRGDYGQDEEREISMFQETREVLGAAGLVDYEISNFARPGFESRHNLGYWRGEDYLGLGPSACSTIGTLRWKNIPDTKAYAERIAKSESVRTDLEKIDESIRTREKIMFGLRMREGVTRDLFSDTDQLLNLERDGLAKEVNGRVLLTLQGQLVADSVAEMFV